MQIHSKWSDIAYKTEARKLLQWQFKDVDDYLNARAELMELTDATKFEPVIVKDRESLGAGYLFKWWEYLAGELLKEAERREESLAMPPGFTTYLNE